jgi:hypothetical protein
LHLHSFTHTHLGWGRVNRRPPRSFQVRFGCASPHVVQRALASARVRESAPPCSGFGGGGGGVYASHRPLDTEPRVCGSRPVATSCALVHGPMSPHGVPAFIAPVAGCMTPPMHDVSVGVVIAPSPTDKCWSWPGGARADVPKELPAHLEHARTRVTCGKDAPSHVRPVPITASGRLFDGEKHQQGWTGSSRGSVRSQLMCGGSGDADRHGELLGRVRVVRVGQQLRPRTAEG